MTGRDWLAVIGFSLVASLFIYGVFAAQGCSAKPDPKIDDRDCTTGAFAMEGRYIGHAKVTDQDGQVALDRNVDFSVSTYKGTLDYYGVACTAQSADHAECKVTLYGRSTSVTIDGTIELDR
ncbi:MAG: hypothetical protein GTN93_32545, partial [Anaerolineae bacterium]|nr:hypothetical protein [Anaerolineae bacterium]